MTRYHSWERGRPVRIRRACPRAGAGGTPTLPAFPSCSLEIASHVQTSVEYVPAMTKCSCNNPGPLP